MSTSHRPGRSLRAGTSLAVVLTVAHLCGQAAQSPAEALSCVEARSAALMGEHLFTAHAVSARGHHYLMEVESQRPGDSVPPRVWVHVDLHEWLGWGDQGYGEASPVGTDRLLLVSTDAGWSTSPCSMWEVVPGSDHLDGVLELASEPVDDSVADPEQDPERAPGNPPDFGRSRGELAVAAAAGTGLGALALAVCGVAARRRSHREPDRPPGPSTPR